jgi:hypothetical protein
MGNISSYQKCTFEDMQTNIQSNNVCIINVLPEDEQHCLIQGTTIASKEVELINTLLRQDKTRHIIIYGKNYLDLAVFKKYKQLRNLGFKNVSIYIGGIFEWLCLQEIYGNSLFPTTSMERDILKFKT